MMSQRLSWFERVVFGCFTGVGLAYLAVAWALPGWIVQQVRHITHDTVTIDRVWLEFPLNVVLSGVRMETGQPETVVTSDRIVISPRWISWTGHTTWISAIEVREPHARLSRTSDGTLLWPSFDHVFALPTDGASSSDVPAGSPHASAVPWRFVIKTIRMSGGTVALIDQQPPQPFRAAVADLSLVGGPIEIPFRPGHMFLVIQGRVVREPHAAPIYCSGWMDVPRQDLDVSCRLDPLPLAMFEPYYQGSLQVHVYNTTLAATAHLTARANVVDGRIQLGIGNLTEGDVSRAGWTVADIKKIVPNEAQRVLTGEVKIAGPLNQIADWQLTLVPGNDVVQRLIKPLLNRRIQRIEVKVGDTTIPVGLTPASQADMSDIAAGTQQVKEALEIIAPTSQPVSAPAKVMPAPVAAIQPVSPAVEDSTTSTSSPPASEATPAPAAPAQSPPVQGSAPPAPSPNSSP